MLQKVLEVNLVRHWQFSSIPSCAEKSNFCKHLQDPATLFSHCDYSFTPSLCRHKGERGVLRGTGGVDTIHSSSSSPLPVQDRPIFRRPVVWMLKIELQVRKRESRGQRWGGVGGFIVSTVHAPCDVSLRESAMWEKKVEPQRLGGSVILSCLSLWGPKNMDVWFGASLENRGVF